MISILLPTRKRTRGLRDAVDSLYLTSRTPDDLELLLRVDDDDPTDYSSYEHRDHTVVIRGERWGYTGMHRYYDQLSRAASGDWLLIWNDDAIMLTGGWDTLLLERTGKLCVQFLKRDELTECDTTFPAYPAKLLELMGPLADNCHVDSWLDYVAGDSGIKVMRNDIEFHHYRPEDDTANERVYAWEQFQTGRPLRAEQSARIRSYLEQHPTERP